MRKLMVCVVLCCTVSAAFAQQKFNDTTLLQAVEVEAVRAGDKAPFAKSNLFKKDIEKINLGQDLPFILNQLPSVVVNSDAGNGVGYTGIRIRGTDATRINVTLNGIPYNDAESQGTFFVDLPDIASSANSIQVQRGVGTSSNGAGAFGASINISTNEMNKKFYIGINNSYGSFATWKNNLQFGTGMLGKHFLIEGRVSSIFSQGYIDRASTRLGSAAGSIVYENENNSFRLNVISGKEKTYQAWNGVPEYLLASNRTYNSAGTERPVSPYDNETDNYLQTHYQLFYNHKFNDNVKSNIGFFFTKGRGYYEQYKADNALSDYGLATLDRTDLVRRLWLDNEFSGCIFSLHYNQEGTQFVFGGGYNSYDGNHYGEIIWAAQQASVPKNYHWYDLTAFKKDFSFYGKWSQQVNNQWQVYADLQFRHVNYEINGFRYNPTLLLKNEYGFLNPKVGITYTKDGWQAYVSYAKAAKEPNRDDFEAGKNQQPKPEKLDDFEWGVEKKGQHYLAGINFYYMLYHDQLVLTGKINDVGAYTRTNISKSYRAGIEVQGAASVTKWLNVSANITLSENKIKDFTEFVDDYDNGGQQTNFYKKTDISFSPAVVAGGMISFIPLKNAELSFISKYVSRQYLDNTSMRSRSLDPYYLQDIRLSYLIEKKIMKSTHIIFQLNNFFNKKYEPNGYSFSYIYGGALTTENFYFPMAGLNWMVGLNIKL